jgi:hypothetical protein
VSRKPGDPPYRGFLAFEFLLCIVPGFMASCSKSAGFIDWACSRLTQPGDGPALDDMKPVLGSRALETARWKRVTVSLILGVAAIRAIPAAESESNAAWRPLRLISNGRIDPAWVHVGWGGFALENDTLRTECDPRGLGLLVYKPERLGNCQIRVVYKAKDAKSNAGVYVRLPDGIFDQVGKPGAAFDRSTGKISKDSMEKMKVSADRNEGAWFAVHNGYEVQIGDTGSPFHRTGAIYSLAPSSAEPKPGEWRTMIITLAGEKIGVDLDGQRVTSFDPQSATVPPRKNWPEPKREPPRPVSGYIGLQNHDPGNVVWFKEVSVRPLPASEKNRFPSP